MRWLVPVLLLVLVGCNLVPRTVAIDDQRIRPLLEAANSFNRASYGFTPIPKSGKVGWESRPTQRYDAMLHIDSKTSRTIAFRRTSDGFRWTGEQEIFYGPKQFRTVDGTFHEQICLTYDVETISGYPTNQLNITYSGEDIRLTFPKKLTLALVKPVLNEWGY